DVSGRVRFGMPLFAIVASALLMSCVLASAPSAGTLQCSRVERHSTVATPGGSMSAGNTASAAVDETPASGLVTDESGHADTFDLVLTSQPSADVTFALTSSDPAEGLPTPSSITFTPADWNVPQTITVTGIDDAVDDGDVAYS